MVGLNSLDPLHYRLQETVLRTTKAKWNLIPWVNEARERLLSVTFRQPEPNSSSGQRDLTFKAT